MKQVAFFTSVCFAIFLSLLGLVENTFAQTAIDNPAGTVVTLSSNDDRAIGLTGGQTYTYSNSNWPGCITWGLPTSGLNLINGNVAGGPGNTSGCSYNSLSFNTGNGTNLAGGIAAWIGNTNYRASNGSTYTTYSVSTRLLITVTDNSNNPIELYQSGGYISMAVPAGNNTFKVKVELQATRPSGAVYATGTTQGNTGTCNTGVGSWSPAIHLYNCLGTQSTYKICTQYPSTPNSRVFYQGFTNSTTAPSVSSTSPASTSGGTTTNPTMTFNWSGSMGSHPGSQYQYRLNGGSWSNTIGTTASRSLSVGANTFCVRYYDGCNDAYYPNTTGSCYTIYYAPNNACNTTIDHGGNDWTISSNTTVAGNHINVGTFTVSSTATVANGCALEVSAQDVNITGTINGTGKGNVGGGSPGGAGGCYNCSGITGCTSKDNCWDLRTYGGNAGNNGSGLGRGLAGGTGGTGRGKKQQCFDWDDEGGRVGGAGGGGGGGGGSYGGSGGAAANGGSGGSASACREAGCGTYAVGSGGSGGGTSSTYGAASTYNIEMGSGGAASGGGGRGQSAGSAGGGNGGNGGGKIKIEAANNMTITGTIYANGTNGSGSGGKGGNAGETGECCGDWSGGCDERTYTAGGGGGGGAGGGSGGGILLRADGDMNIGNANLQARGGNGGSGGAGGNYSSTRAHGGNSGGTGGKGGGGRIKVFYNPCANNTLNPTRSVAAGSGNGSGGAGTYTENPYGIIPGGTTVPNGTYVWNGQTSTNWNTGSNWSRLNGTTWTTGSVPGTTAHVIVPAPPCTPRNPTISTNAGTIKTLEIHALDGAEVTITCPDCLDVTD